jgi:hypothetical protein
VTKVGDRAVHCFITGTGEMPPNQILFVSNLPEETTDQMLQMLFAQ